MSKVDLYVHAALLLHGAGNEVTADGIVAVVKAAGAEPDEAKAKVLAEALKGKNIDEMLETPAIAVAAAPAQAAASATEEKKEEKKEEQKDEKKSEEEAAAGLAGLFG